MTIGSRVRDGLILLGGLLLALLFVDSVGGPVYQTYALRIGILVVLVVSLNLANGFTSVFTLGQMGFMALGAYISAILTLSVKSKARDLRDLPDFLAGFSLDQMVGPVPLGWIAATLIAAL